MIEFFIINTLGHLLEHIVQIIQLYVLNWERSEALGLLGCIYPWLVRSELLHLGFAILMWLGIYILGNKGRAYNWQGVFCFQTYHLVEHITLTYQHYTGQYFFNKSVPTTLLQLVIPRIELHFIYTIIVTTLILLALYKDGKLKKYYYYR